MGRHGKYLRMGLAEIHDGDFNKQFPGSNYCSKEGWTGYIFWLNIAKLNHFFYGVLREVKQGQ